MTGMIVRSGLRIAAPVGPGVFMAVVGPSGAGKDTLIAYARERAGQFSRPVRFVRRIITRLADVASEDHDTLDEAAFEAAERAGAFALAWPAHGLRYGLPADTDAIVGAGLVAVANLSRAALPALRQRYANVAVVHVTANPAVLAERLAARGRESREAILARLTRTSDEAAALEGAAVIVNDGPPEVAGERFMALLREAIAGAAPSANGAG